MRRLGGLSSSLFALLGCGDDPVNRLADAPPALDGGVDGANVDAAPPPATVVTTFARCCTTPAGTPEAGVPVVVLGPDGALAQMGTTGVDGKATFQNVAPGSTITAFYPESPNLDNVYATVAGVKPGDQLQFGDSYYEGDNPTGVAGTMTITYAAAAQGDHYEGQTGCTFASDPAPATLAQTFTTFAYCQKPTMPALLYAYNAGNALIATSYVPAANGTDGATTAAPAWVPLPTTPNVTSTFPNPPPEITSSEFFVSAVFPLDGDGGGDFTNYSTADDVSRLPTNGVRQVHGARHRRDGAFGAKLAYAGAAANATTATFSTPATLPWLSDSISISSLGVGWLQTPGTYDAGHISVFWSVFDPAMKANHNYYWSITVPPGQTQFSLAQFPAALADRLPPADAFVFGDARVIDLADAADYDAARAVPEWQLTEPDEAVRLGEQSRVDFAASDGAEGSVVTRVAPRRQRQQPSYLRPGRR